MARGEANENSDLDIIVRWDPDRSLLDHAAVVQDLEALLGIKVHVGTEKLASLIRARQDFSRGDASVKLHSTPAFRLRLRTDRVFIEPPVLSATYTPEIR